MTEAEREEDDVIGMGSNNNLAAQNRAQIDQLDPGVDVKRAQWNADTAVVDPPSGTDPGDEQGLNAPNWWNEEDFLNQDDQEYWPYHSCIHEST